MSFSIDNNLADERILRKYFAQTIFEIFNSHESTIVFIRENRNNQSLYRNLEKMIGKWSFSYSLSDTKRFRND